jgi:hypothetical protein
MKPDEFAALGGDPALHQAMRSSVAEQAIPFDSRLARALGHKGFHEGNVLVTRDSGGWVMGELTSMDATAFAFDVGRKRSTLRSRCALGRMNVHFRR